LPLRLSFFLKAWLFLESCSVLDHVAADGATSDKCAGKYMLLAGTISGLYQLKKKKTAFASITVTSCKLLMIIFCSILSKM
jgi:hypothetical protein